MTKMRKRLSKKNQLKSSRENKKMNKEPRVPSMGSLWMSILRKPSLMC